MLEGRRHRVAAHSAVLLGAPEEAAECVWGISGHNLVHF